MEETIRKALEERAQGPIFPGRFGSLPRSRFAETAPTPADFAAALARSPRGTVAAKLAAFAQGEPGDLVTQHRDYGRCFNPNQALGYCEQVLDDVEAARVALGDYPPERIPRYARWTGGCWAYMDPQRDYFATPLTGQGE
jgi:hypothetical protein